MARKITGTEFVGKHNRRKATGILKDIGIKELYSKSRIDLNGIVDYLLATEPEKLTEHAYRFGKYMVKFYPPESLGFLGYCRQLGLPVENPLAMGVNERDEGDIVIVDTIEGKDYRDIVLEERKDIFGQVKIPQKEMSALGHTFYLFCSKGVAAGDSKLQNYMHDGTQAVRIDLIPQYDSFLDINWDEISQNTERIKEKPEELSCLISEVECIFIDMAEKLTHQTQSARRFSKILEAFLHGYVNDYLSKAFACVFQQNSQQELVECMQRAERESKSFQGVYWPDKFTKMAEETGTVTIRMFEH